MATAAEDAFGSSGPVKATATSSSAPQRVVHHLKHLFDAPTCPVTSVIVYTEKAEVSRFLRCSIRNGENEIVIGRLSHAIDKDSIRVELHGRGCIQEVLYRAIPVAPEEDENHQHYVDLTRELADAKRQKETLTAKKHRAAKQRTVLDSFADNIMKAESGRDKNGDLTSVSNVMDAGLLQGMSNFFDMYEKHAEKLDSQLMELTTELKDLDLQMENLEQAVKGLAGVKEERRKRYLSILIDAYDEGEVEIHFSYVVSKVKWTPRYDIRVFSRDNALKLMYFGSIQNNTGEDWADAKLSLSTAMPSNAVVAPSDLGVQKLFFKPTKYTEGGLQIVPTNALQSLAKGGGGSGSFKLRHRRSSKDHTHQILLTTKSNSTSSPASPASTPTSPTSPTTPPVSPNAPPPPPGFPGSSTTTGGSTTPQSGGTLKRGSRAGSLSSVPETAMIQEALQDAAEQLTRKSEYPYYSVSAASSTMTKTTAAKLLSGPLLSSSSTSLLADGGKVVTVLEGGSEAKDQIPCATFEISRKSSIVANNEGHKVAIGIIDFNPVFEYESIPKKAPHAYLKARLKNLSSMALLPGSANVYIDNNYISKTDIRLVSPQEEFYCLLGSDPGVEIKYNPAHKIRETSNLSGKVITTTFRQVTEVKNSYSEPIKILIIDQLPISSEEKIKVTLQDPVIKHPEKMDKSKPIRMAKNNLIEWDIEIGANKSHEVVLKYAVDHPPMEDVDLTSILPDLVAS